MSVLNSFIIAGVLAASATASQAVEIPGVRVDHAAARVVVIAEPRSDYAISIDQGRAGLRPLVIRKDGGVTVVDGGYGSPTVWHMGWDNLNCKGGWDHNPRVSVPSKGDVALADLPVVTIRAPLDAKVAGSGAVYGEVGPTNSLSVGNSGCGDWTVADVKGPLHIAMAGSGDLRGQASGEAHVAVAGSADVSLGPVSGMLETRTSGSGDIRVASARGPVSTRIAGSGDVTVSGGDSPEVSVSIAGSGDFRFRGNAGAVKASVAGSGDVQIAHASGPVSKHVAGSGEVTIGR